MKMKGLITKIVIVAVIIATTSLIAVVKHHSFQGVINNNFRNSGDNDFYAHPNPFEDFTVITVVFDTPETGTLRIEDGNGKVVKELHRGLFSGMMDFNWNATDEKNEPVTPGVYYCKLNTGNQYTSRTIILILK